MIIISAGVGQGSNKGILVIQVDGETTSETVIGYEENFSLLVEGPEIRKYDPEAEIEHQPFLYPGLNFHRAVVKDQIIDRKPKHVIRKIIH